MTNPWTEWRRLWRAGAMLSETISASQAVVGHRTRTIENALTDPAHADLGELNRMVSEKAKAFGAASASLSRDWVDMQREWEMQLGDISVMMLGRLPNVQKSRAMLARSQRLSSAALASSVRAMAPIHQAATANQRRLARKL